MSTMTVAAPVITAFWPDTQTAGDSNTDSDIVTLSGTAAADSTVTVYDGSTVLGTATADGSGAWSYTTSPLSDSEHSISATATDSSGEVSAHSASSLVTVGPAIASFSALTDQWSSPISVDGQPFYVENSNIDGNAPWNIAQVDTHTLRFEERPNDLWPDDGTQRTEVASNNIISQSSVFNIAYSFMIDPGTLPNTAGWLVMGQIHGDDNLAVGSVNPLGILMNNNGASDGQHLQVWITYLNTAGNAVDVMVYQDPDPIQGSHWYNVRLTGKPGVDGTGFLNVWIDGAEVAAYHGNFGSAADQNYYWKYGIYEGGATDTLAVSYRNMTIDATTTSLDRPNVTSFAPDSNHVGDGITNTNELTLSGTAAANSTVTVYDGLTQIGTAEAGATGVWSLATSVLADGSHSFTATMTDVDNNTSPESTALAVTVDTVAPNAPVISGDVVSVTGHVTLTGTAEAGSLVTVFDGANSLGTAVVDGSGNWSFVDGLANGTHDLTAHATDAAGNTGAASVVSTAVVEIAPNLVVNGGFETQDFSGWTISGNTAYASPWGTPRDGFNAASLGPDGSDGILSQTLQTVAGRHYVLDFWLQNLETSGPDDFTAKWDGVAVLSLVDTGQQNYTEYTFDVVATGSTTQLEFDYRNDGTFWNLDSIFVTEQHSYTTGFPGGSVVATGDFNGDGTSDILWQQSNHQLTQWLMQNTGIPSQTNVGSTGASGEWHAIATGDFNNDGHTDLLWENTNTGDLYQWLMGSNGPSSQSALGSAAGGWSLLASGDFNGDHKTDLLWQHAGDGQLVEWTMNGSSITSQATLGSSAGGWGVLAQGDFNHDGTSDFIWENASSGQLVEWQMGASGIASQSTLGSAAGGWNVIAQADFNGDGTPDLLWENASTGQLVEWQMGGSGVSSQTGLGSAAGGWNILTQGDFNGDGKTDLLWENASTGQLVEWVMGASGVASQPSLGSAAGGWNVIAQGDFNADGTTDLLWQQNSSGTVYEWLMGGSGIAAQQALAPPAAGAQLVAHGDFNNDGTTDLVWQAPDGSTSTWLFSHAFAQDWVVM